MLMLKVSKFLIEYSLTQPRRQRLKIKVFVKTKRNRRDVQTLSFDWKQPTSNLHCSTPRAPSNFQLVTRADQLSFVNCTFTISNLERATDIVTFSKKLNANVDCKQLDRPC